MEKHIESLNAIIANNGSCLQPNAEKKLVEVGQPNDTAKLAMIVRDLLTAAKQPTQPS